MSAAEIAAAGWHQASVTGWVRDHEHAAIPGAACSLSESVLLLPAARLRALGLIVGVHAWVRAAAIGAASSPQQVPTRIHVLTDEVRRQVRSPRHTCADADGDRAVIASASLLSHFIDCDPASGDVGLAAPLMLEVSTAAPFQSTSLPVALHVVLRAVTFASGTTAPPQLLSFDFLSSFLPSILHGRVISPGTRLHVDLLRTVRGIGWLEVIEAHASVPSEQTTPDEFPLVYRITNQTAISLRPCSASAALTTPPLPPSFPASVDSWLARVYQHVYGYRPLVTAWVESMWHTVQQYADEAAMHQSAATIGSRRTPLSAYSPHTFLVHGMSGTGKSHLCRTISGTSGLPSFFLHASALFQRVEGSSETGLVRVFQAARDLRRPCIIVLDEVDTILPKARGDDAPQEEDEDTGAAIDQDQRGWNMGNSRIEWRLVAVLKELLQEINGLDLPLSFSSVTVDSPSGPSPPIFVFFTTSSPSSLDASGLRISPFVDQELELKSLQYDERVEALGMAMRRFQLDEDDHVAGDDLTPETSVTTKHPAAAQRRRRLFERLASELHGFVGADMDGFVRESLLAALKRSKSELDATSSGATVLTAESVRVRAVDFESVLQWFHPSNLQQIEFRLPQTAQEQTATSLVTTTGAPGDANQPLPFSTFASHFSSLAGITPLLQHLHYSFLLPIKQPQLYHDVWRRTLGMQASKGVLIYGPGGTGKTALAVCLARACGLNAMVIPSTSLVSKVLGSSEKALASIFAKARASAPSLLIFDQMEMIAPVRKGLTMNEEDEEQIHESDAYERILSVLLIEMDGVLASNEKEQVYVVATSTRPDLIDPALLRPSRLDAHINLPAPDQPARLEILTLIMRDTPLFVETDEQQRVVVPREFSLTWSQLDQDLQQRITQWNWNQTSSDATAISTSTSATSADAPSSEELRGLFLLLLSHVCAHFSGADLVALQRESAMHALRVDLTATVVCSWRDVLQATLRGMKGSLVGDQSYYPFGRTPGWAIDLSAFGAPTATMQMTTTSKPIFSKKAKPADSNTASRSTARHTFSTAASSATDPPPFVFGTAHCTRRFVSVCSSSSPVPVLPGLTLGGPSIVVAGSFSLGTSSAELPLSSRRPRDSR